MKAAGQASRRFWDRAARSNAAWYIATGHTAETEEFFEQGAAETDSLLALCGIELHGDETVLEIGCGVGRMTRRLSQLSRSVVAVDVSPEMLDRCGANVQGYGDVACVLVPGDGSMPKVDGRSVDVVFSYITMQHVPSAAAQRMYLRESARVLKPGGRIGIQVRDGSLRGRALDWAGHLGHALQRRATLSRSWRGAHLSERAIRSVLEPAGMDVSLTRHYRHLWVVGLKKGD